MATLLAPLQASAADTATEDDSLIVRLSRRVEATISLRDYLTFDKRTLGLSRILLGFLLIGDLFHRGRFWLELYSDEGILPRGSAAIKSSVAFSIFNAFGTPGELRVLFVLMLATFVCLLVGYKTRLSQILALVFVTSMDARTTIIDNAGYIAESLLLLWTCFLPLGDRFSVDSLLAGMKRIRFFQGWNVMAPQALMDDGVLVVDAITVDGRHVDPLSLHAAPYTLRAPNFDLAHAKGLGFDQVWIEYLARMSDPRFESYHAPLEAYLLRLPERTGHPEDALVSADVYWIGDQNPRWDEKESWGFEQRKLFSFTAP